MKVQQGNEQLLRAYRNMKTIREFEERLHKEIMTGEIAGFTHLYSGQEAVAVGVCEHLDADDLIVSTHRGHGHCIAKGCDVKGMMAEIYGRATGLGKGKGGSMHIADFDKGMLGANGIVGAGAPLAVGAALSLKLDGKGRVAVTFGGDGSVNQGAVFEAMNLAVVLKLPVVFVVENNGYSEHTGADYAVGSKDIAARAAGFGMKSLKADGSDYFAVWDAMAELVDHARAGKGPCAVEFKTTRFFGHFEGDPQKYRAKDEVKRHRAEMDCLKIFRERVTGAGLVDVKSLDAVDGDVLRLIDEAVAEARTAPPPAPAEILTDVYVAYR
jgi:pyruvate dehydrogenase E1 component alpha subunit